MSRTSCATGPIGIFDSGVGGLTNARSIITKLPHEAIIYVGDTAHNPYGPKSIDEVKDYAQAIADDLVERGCKMLVIACNTASAAFLQDARERYQIPVVEVIRPAVRRAIATTKTGRIGVIGTEGTIASGVYQKLFALTPGTQVSAAACPEFVSFVERGITSGRQVQALAEEYLAPLIDDGIDTLVLGCTHYPLLSGVIQLVVGDNVALVSSAEETAKDVVRILTQKDLLADPDQDIQESPTRIFESTGDPEKFQALASRFLGPYVTTVNQSQPRN